MNTYRESLRIAKKVAAHRVKGTSIRASVRRNRIQRLGFYIVNEVEAKRGKR